MIKIRNYNGRIRVESPYNPEFIDRMHLINGKWDRNNKEWTVEEEHEDLMYKALSDIYGYSKDKSKLVTIEFRPWDFEDDCGNQRIKIGSVTVASRSSRDSKVFVPGNARVIEGQFEESGGSRNHPAVGTTEDIVMQADVPAYIVENLSEDDKNKIKIINKKSKEEKLLLEKEELLKRLEEIEEELKNIEGEKDE